TRSPTRLPRPWRGRVSRYAVWGATTSGSCEPRRRSSRRPDRPRAPPPHSCRDCRWLRCRRCVDRSSRSPHPVVHQCGEPVERLLDLAVDVRAVLAAQRLRLVTRERHVQGCQGAVAGAVRLGLLTSFVTGVRTDTLQLTPVSLRVEVAVLVADLAAAGHPGMEGP